jgi:amphi-Trp domain-containing protein
MADVELKRTETLSRTEAAERLSALAEALSRKGKIELDVAGTTLSLRIPDQVSTEFELEVDGDRIELELELRWSTSPGGSASAGSEPAAVKADAAAAKDDAPPAKPARRQSGKQ